MRRLGMLPGPLVALAVALAAVALAAPADLDRSFSGDGKRVLDFGNGSAPDIGDGAAIQRNGRIVAAGYSDQGASGNDFAIARLLGG